MQKPSRENDSWAKRGHMSCKWPLLLSAQSLAHKFSFWADIGESIPFQRRLRSGEPGRCNRLAALDYDMVKALEPSAWQTLVTVVQKGEPKSYPEGSRALDPMREVRAKHPVNEFANSLYPNQAEATGPRDSPVAASCAARAERTVPPSRLNGRVKSAQIS